MRKFNYLYIHFHSVLFLVNLMRPFRGVSDAFKNLINKFGNTDLFCNLAIQQRIADVHIKIFRPIGGVTAIDDLNRFFVTS